MIWVAAGLEAPLIKSSALAMSLNVGLLCHSAGGGHFLPGSIFQRCTGLQRSTLTPGSLA